jgi:Cu(I)/Ag(I) efflux system membrane fusion protein
MSTNGLPGSNEPAPTRWQKIRMIVKVVELRLRFIALMAATGLVFGYWDTIGNYYAKWTRPHGEAHAAASGTEFFCPMHPTVIQAEAGGCPICGMPLSKRQKGEKATLPAGVLARVALDPLRVTQAGIKTSDVAYAPLVETITTVGSVAFDERRMARISSKTKGMARVEKLHVNFNGIRVKAGEPLAELYSPELYQTMRELLLAQAAAKDGSRPQSKLGQSLLGDSSDLIGLAREKLGLWGITPAQVDEILAKGKADVRVPILSPIGGIVVRKNIVEGEYVLEGQSMFEVADLGHVWVLAQVFEDQFATVREGQEVEATVKAYPGETFKGRVAFVAPALNPATRTVDVRYDLENLDERLRPGMLATVTLKTPFADSPAFRSKMAARAPGRKTVLTVAEQKVCPVTTLKLGAMGEPVPVEVAGEHIWLCCGSCSDKLRAQPTKYLDRLAAAPSGAVLTVPESAVIDTGTRKVVYVETDPGVFEGRAVVLGPISGDRYPVLEGLYPGERVATSGSFLIDAENRLNPSSPSPTPATKKAEPEPVRSAARTSDVKRY